MFRVNFSANEAQEVGMHPQVAILAVGLVSVIPAPMLRREMLEMLPVERLVGDK